MNRKKVLIVYPLTWDYIPRYFHSSLLGWALFLKDRYDFAVIDGQATFVDESRDLLLKIAHEDKKAYDYILMLDADQCYPMETIDVLVGHIDNGHRVVAGLTASRQYGYPLVFRLENLNPPRFARIKDFNMHQGLVPVDGTGMGGIMMHRSILDEVPFPRFMMIYDEYLKRPPGEDTVFYANLKKAGIQAWLDCRLRYEHLRLASIRPGDFDATKGLGMPVLPSPIA